MYKIFPLVILVGLLTACGKPQASTAAQVDAEAAAMDRNEINEEVTAAIEETKKTGLDDGVQPTEAAPTEDATAPSAATAAASTEATKPE